MKTEKKSSPFILIDGSSYLYRAFHALPPLANAQGEPTGAVLGVANMIRKLLTDFAPEYVAVVFDAKGRSFRHEIYPEYKANRPSMPPDLQMQIKPLHELVRAMGLPLICIEGVEADDVIATLALQAKNAGMDVLISTGDKDIAQLVCDNIRLINTMNDLLLDVAGVKNKFHVMPEQMVDYLALVGDSSDNIPGVPKVGPKTAAKWLEEYGSLDNIVKNADKFTGKVGDYLRDSLAQLRTTKELVTLKYDIELGFAPEDLTKKTPERAKLISLLTKLEFRKWLAEVLQQQKHTALSLSNKNYYTILTEKAFDYWLQKLTQAECFAFDLETNSLNTIETEIVGVSFALHPGEAIYIPVAHSYVGAPKQLERAFILEKIKPLLENKKIVKLGQNLKFDIEVLANYNIDVANLGFDTMLESYVLNSTANRHDMDSLALKYLGVKTTSFVEVAGKGKKQLTFDQIDLAEAAPYAAEDADIVLQLHEKMWSLISPHPGMVTVFSAIEMPLVKVLAKIERKGVCIDKKILESQSKSFAIKIEKLEAEAYELAGEEFNLASPKQLREILFDKLEIPVSKKTPTGQPSTAENVLQNLALDYELPKIILQHRTISKLKSTYTDALPKQISPKTNRVHTSYNQAVTSTGRLSSTDPNLQNIPVRSHEGRKIRQAFIAAANKKLISADYSQIELRIMAHLSKDPSLLKAFANGDDIHSATAAEVLGVAIEDVTKEQRRRAKAVNFGLIYGMSAFGLAKQLSCSRNEAQRYIDMYFERYPGVQFFMQQMRREARQNGFVETLFGRRLYVPEINSSNYLHQQAAERAAINAPMQGTAADIIKMAMINIDEWIEHSSIDMAMIMQVHDELVFEVAADQVNDAVAAVENLMVNVVKIAVPLAVDIGVGDNWDEAH